MGETLSVFASPLLLEAREWVWWRKWVRA